MPRLLILLATLTLSLNALAQEVSPINIPVPVPEITHSFYFEGNAGIAWQNWPAAAQSLVDVALNDSFTVSPHSLHWSGDTHNGFSYGVDMGWQFLPRIAIEAGGYNLGKVRFQGSELASWKFTGTIHSWFAYLGLRYTLIDTHSFLLFGKIATVYNHVFCHYYLDIDSSPVNAQYPASYTTALGALSAQLNLSSNLFINAQVMYIISGGGVFFVPAKFIASAGIGVRI